MEVTEIYKEPRIAASNLLWDAFGKWMDQHGYKTLTEGFRAAMVEVTGFKPESQGKTLIGGGRVV